MSHQVEIVASRLGCGARWAGIKALRCGFRRFLLGVGLFSRARARPLSHRETMRAGRIGANAAAFCLGGAVRDARAVRAVVNAPARARVEIRMFLFRERRRVLAVDPRVRNTAGDITNTVPEGLVQELTRPGKDVDLLSDAFTLRDGQATERPQELAAFHTDPRVCGLRPPPRGLAALFCCRTRVPEG